MTDSKKGCCCAEDFPFDDQETARGYNWIGGGRGPIVMSNVFYASALIYLASESVGCTEQVWDGATNTTSWVVEEHCDEKVYGVFKPAALISNIGVISGLLSALLMPVIGAVVDYTPHRWTVGVVAAILMILIQGIQIGTVSSTWFAMSILQAITGFFYQMHILAVYAYLPDISGAVGENKMTRFTSIFSSVQFAAQALFLIMVVGLSTGLGLDDVTTAQASQAINTIWIIICFYYGWKLMPKVGARQILPTGHSLLLEGFRQNWNTVKRIQRDYKKSLRWYMLALIFAEATASAFTVVAVVFLSEEMGFSGSEIGIFFLVALLAMIPGGSFGFFVTSRTNPNTSWRLSLLMLCGLGLFAGLVLNKDSARPLNYIWGMFVGLTLGWFYPTENLFFSLIVPKGQEAELAGFFVYCSQIIAWLPPLIFSIMLENDIEQGMGVIAVGSFAIIAVFLLCMAPSWEEIIDDVHKTGGAVVGVKPLNSTDKFLPDVASAPCANSFPLSITAGAEEESCAGNVQHTFLTEGLSPQMEGENTDNPLDVDSNVNSPVGNTAKWNSSPRESNHAAPEPPKM